VSIRNAYCLVFQSFSFWYVPNDATAIFFKIDFSFENAQSTTLFVRFKLERDFLKGCNPSKFIGNYAVATQTRTRAVRQRNNQIF